MTYCGDCGTENLEDKKFCWKCGRPMHIGNVAEYRKEETRQNIQTAMFQSLPPAPLGKRLVAFVIDGIAIWIMYFVLRLFIPERLSLAGFGVLLAYFVLLGTFTGTSLGKYAFGLYLVKRDGTAPGFVRVAARYFGMFLLSPLWIAWWTVPFRKDCRAIHDIGSGTMLVERHVKNSRIRGFATLLLLMVILGIIVTNDPVLYQTISGLVGSNAQDRLASELAQVSILVPTFRAPETQVAVNFLATQTASALFAKQSAPPTYTPPTYTPVPTSTPRPSATLTPEPTTLVFADDFTSVCNLPTRDDADVTLECENGEYTMLDKRGNFSSWVYYKDQYDNTVIEADAHALSERAGIQYGIAFRISSDGRSFYWFNLATDGYYSVQYHAQSTWIALIPYTPSAAAKGGLGHNRLKVIVQGSQIDVYANDQFLNTVTDTKLTNGMVGFAFGVPRANDKVAFDNLSIVKINRPLLVPTAKAGPPVPTPKPAIPSGMGGIVVDNYCGFEVNLEVAGKLYIIPMSERIYIYVPPGHYPVSATAAGKRLTCGASGCSLDVELGLYTPYPYCAKPPE